MLKPRIDKSLVLFFCICLSLSASIVAAQGTGQQVSLSADTEQGIKLYREGDTKGAVKSLSAAVAASKDDSEAWYYLGLALAREDDLKGARKALETAAKLRQGFAGAHASLSYVLLRSDKLRDAEKQARLALKLEPTRPEAHYVLGVVYLNKGAHDKALESAEAILKASPEFSPALFLKVKALVGLYGDKYVSIIERYGRNLPSSEQAIAERKEKQDALKVYLRGAFENMRAFMKANPNHPDAAALSEYMETLRIYGGDGGETDERTHVFKAGETMKKAVILFKPEPAYTPAARADCIDGVVRLRLVLSSDGTVKHILPIKTLSHGLTENSIDSARKIKFIPALKDGRPVSQVVTVEYNFNCY
jgi:tetratricopeptide (TPR) repeat protein